MQAKYTANNITHLTFLFTLICAVIKKIEKNSLKMIKQVSFSSFCELIKPDYKSYAKTWCNTTRTQNYRHTSKTAIICNFA